MRRGESGDFYAKEMHSEDDLAFLIRALIQASLANSLCKPARGTYNLLRLAATLISYCVEYCQKIICNGIKVANQSLD